MIQVALNLLEDQFSFVLGVHIASILAVQLRFLLFTRTVPIIYNAIQRKILS